MSDTLKGDALLCHKERLLDFGDGPADDVVFPTDPEMSICMGHYHSVVQYRTRESCDLCAAEKLAKDEEQAAG